MPISAVVNTYNAEKTLRRSLETLTKFDEIVVCDMESTDATVEIAKEFGCKVVTFPKENHKSAEPARTFAIQSASSEWVLVVDADELIPSALREYLYARIQEPDCPAGLYIPRRNYMLNQFVKSSYPDAQLRFFKREGTVWPPYVHTFPKVEGRLERIPASRTDLAMVHLSCYMHDLVDKLNQYTDNEVYKRKGTHVTMLSLIFQPFWRFFKSYILKGGIFHGKLGYIRANQESFYRFVMQCKILENECENDSDIKVD